MALIADVFNSDPFGCISLTKNINNIPYKAKFLEGIGLFQGDGAGSGAGVSTQQMAVVNQDGKLTLIPAAGLGTMPNFQKTNPKDIRYFTIPHLPLNDAVIAAELNQKASFYEDGMGSTVETVQAALTEKQARFVANHHLTWEWMRVNSVKGVLLDADGSTVIYDWFAEFGITKKTITWTQATPGDFNRVCDEIQEFTADSLGNDSSTGVTCLMGKTFATAVKNSADLRDGMTLLKDGEFYRTSHVYGAFEYQGINFVHYRGKIGGNPYIADDAAHTFPTGTDAFVRKNAPGSLTMAQGKPGLPMYSNREERRHGTGWDLHTQSNPMFMCQRPGVLIELALA